jgi:hypothetical protein
MPCDIIFYPPNAPSFVSSHPFSKEALQEILRDESGRIGHGIYGIMYEIIERQAEDPSLEREG